jgi:hypothetical protein
MAGDANLRVSVERFEDAVLPQGHLKRMAIGWRASTRSRKLPWPGLNRLRSAVTLPAGQDIREGR